MKVLIFILTVFLLSSCYKGYSPDIPQIDTIKVHFSDSIDYEKLQEYLDSIKNE